MSKMCRFLRYCVSHCLHAAMTRLEEVKGARLEEVKGARLEEVSVWSSVRMVGSLSGVNLLLALFLGLYVRWEKTEGSTILVILVLALLVLGLASVLHYFFNMERLSLSLLHLWFGFLLGLLSFINPVSVRTDVKERAANYMLLASMVLRTMWALLERLFGRTRFRPAFLTSAERVELCGFAVASTTLLINKSVSVSVLLLSLGTVMVALRLKALLSLPCLVSFAVVTGAAFFQSLRLDVNPLALCCFFSQLICDPLLDLYFSGLSVTQRWRPFLMWRGLWRRLSLLPLLLVEVVFLALCARKLLNLDPWFLLVPGFMVTSLFWSISHLVFVATVWGFHTKLSDCQRLCWSQGPDFSGLDKIMASKGMRHYCLVSERLLLFTLGSTVAVGALCWQASSSLFLSFLLLVFPLESLFHGLFYELSRSLGGTSVGYGLVIPTNYCSPDGQPTLLPPESVCELNLRSSAMLGSVQRFLSHHFIESFGCDFSTCGVAMDTLHNKLSSFLDLRTTDGPRHDTYVLYYSGHTHPSGDWALAGGDSLSLQQLVDLWKEKNGGFCSRLIVVLDCENAAPWVNGVRGLDGVYVAVQGATHIQGALQLGDFTAQWVEYNCNPHSDLRWSDGGTAVRAVYGVSKPWGDYSLHLPSDSDVCHHWGAFFPRITLPLVQGALWCGRLDALWLCGLCLRCLKRFKLTWFPPAVLDTGQGFKLVRS
ncbi:unnamed protein product [Knipowitschia caucasica]